MMRKARDADFRIFVVARFIRWTMEFMGTQDAEINELISVVAMKLNHE